MAAFFLGVHQGIDSHILQQFMEDYIFNLVSTFTSTRAAVTDFANNVPAGLALFLGSMGLVPIIWVLLEWMPKVRSQVTLAVIFLFAGILGMAILIMRL